MTKVAIALLICATVAGAQTSTLLGTVVRDSLGHAVGGAEVRFPDLNRRITSNYMGEFRIDGIPPGKHLVTIRSVGFSPLIDSIEATAGKSIDREFVLTPVAPLLDTVRTRAPERKYISPMLAAFEERRRAGSGGYFIADSLFRANDNARLSDLIGRIPGIQKIMIKSGTYIASSRSMGEDGGPALLAKGSRPACYVAVYIDGLKIYQGPPSGANPAPDFDRMNIHEYAAAEFYPGGASIPSQFNATGSACGSLLLWTRER